MSECDDLKGGRTNAQCFTQMISHSSDKVEKEQVSDKMEKPKPFPHLKQNMQKFHSPTDNMFSPATKKIEAKRNYLLKS